MLPYTRREFTKLALAALPAAGLLSTLNRLAAAEAAAPTAKPNSRVNGVQIGLNVPYSFGNNYMPADEVLAACVGLGVSGLELRAQPVEMFLGATPEMLGRRPTAAAGESGGRTADAGGARKRADALREWRKTAPLARVAEFRQKYESAGVFVEILKFDNIFNFADEELDYAFGMAKALGARAISCEIPRDEKRVEQLTRLGSFADKHQLWVGYHGHTKTGPKDWEEAFALAKFNGANVDLGHFVAGNNTSPVPFMKEHHARITHVHVKDKKMNDGPNTVFGEGDTPIGEALRTIRDHKWPIQATIEFEYKVPEGSTRMAEIAKCVKYCRDALA